MSNERKNACAGRRNSAFKSRCMCCVPQCRNRCTPIISLHTFPTHNPLRKTWQHVLKISKSIPKYARVCSAHFVESDFKNVSSNKRRLKSSALPSVNLPKISSTSPFPVKLQKLKKREERRKRLEDCTFRVSLINK